jgi:hypothetical protein
MRRTLIIGISTVLLGILALGAFALAMTAPVAPGAGDPPADPGRDPSEASCSAADLAVIQALRPDVPEPVALKIAAIIAAAQACDFDRLAELALDGQAPFSASFGGIDDGRLAEYWRELEASGEPVTATLVNLLLMPMFEVVAQHGDEQPLTIHVAPRLMAEDATDADRAAAEDIFGAEQVAAWMADGQYVGYRVGITAGGDWQFFLAGD